MIWCIISMISGALIFGCGIIFERLSYETDSFAQEDGAPCDVDEKLFHQWENLMEYDGTIQEVSEDE